MRACCRWLCLGGAFLVLSLSLTAQEQPPRYSIQNISTDGSGFPNVTIRFEIFDNQTRELAKELPQADIIIKEDGEEVARIQPQVQRKAPSLVALAVDTSGSMARANKMNEAKQAAVGFFDRLAPQTPCGLVLFHHEPHTTLTPRLDRAELRTQISQSEPFGGTAYHDAVLKALEFFPESANAGRRALVLMTDGRDVNSMRSLEDAIKEAQKRKVQVFTIGLGKPGQNEYTRTVLVLDRSGSMRDNRKIDNLKKAAVRFLQLMPKGASDTTILPFSDEVDSAEGFTSDLRQLQRRIESLFPSGHTALYDASFEGINTLAAGPDVPGKRMRRAVLVLTDGIDNKSRRDAEDVVRRARLEEVRVFMLGLGTKGEIDERTMRYIASETGGNYYHIENAEKLTEVFENLSIALHDEGIDEDSLRKLAKETGGEYYHVEDAAKLRLKFEEVAYKLENTFTVTYRSKRPVHDGTLRAIEINFEGVAQAKAAVAVHGLIIPVREATPDRPYYLAMCAGLLGLLVLPSMLMFRRKSSSS